MNLIYVENPWVQKTFIQMYCIACNVPHTLVLSSTILNSNLLNQSPPAQGSGCSQFLKYLCVRLPVTFLLPRKFFSQIFTHDPLTWSIMDRF